MSLGKIEPCSEYSQVALSNRVAPSDSYLDENKLKLNEVKNSVLQSLATCQVLSSHMWPVDSADLEDLEHVHQREKFCWTVLS